MIIFLELLLWQEGILIIHCFWTNKGIFSLADATGMGSWDWETIMTDTFQKKLNTSLQSPPFLPTQGIIIRKLWIRKEECGALGTMEMGNWDWATQIKYKFQRIENIPKLKGKDATERIGEKEIFKSVENEQSNELIAKIKEIMPEEVDKDLAKQKILAGVIGMADWPSKWRDIHEKKQELEKCIQLNKLTLHDKKQQLIKLTQEVEDIEQTLSSTQERRQTLEFYDKFLEPIAEAEQELKSGFEEKLKAGKHEKFTVDEVSLFLNVCGMGVLVSQQRKDKIDGEMLGNAMEDVTVLEIGDRLQQKRLKFYLKVLGSGLMMKEEELNQCVVWRHKEVEKTLLLLKEWEIALDEELVRKKGISICQMLYFEVKDFRKQLGVEGKDAIEIIRKMRKMRKDFKEFLLPR